MYLEFPVLVRSLFVQQDANNDTGVYQVRLCKNGHWVVITLDDYFPCHPGKVYILCVCSIVYVCMYICMCVWGEGREGVVFKLRENITTISPVNNY